MDDLNPDDTVDLDAYFARIGYAGPRTSTLETLQALHRLHPQTIPFENFNPLLGWPVKLDSASLQHKLVHSRRGGFCYEHNGLFMRVLQQLGYKVVGLGARVLWGRPEDAITPRTHMLMRVELGHVRWLCDVGFGGLTLTTPLQMGNGAQATPHEPFRLQPLAEGYLLQAQLAGEWKPLYRFDMQRQLPPDYEMAAFYSSRHPASIFVNELMAARTVPEGRHALRNNELSWHGLDGRHERRSLATAAELRQTLDSTFNLALPQTAEVEALLQRLVSPG
jgi:N-hydroxyarylamine O-acetyltransferase